MARKVYAAPSGVVAVDGHDDIARPVDVGIGAGRRGKFRDQLRAALFIAERRRHQRDAAPLGQDAVGFVRDELVGVDHVVTVFESGEARCAPWRRDEDAAARPPVRMTSCCVARVIAT